jgi:heme exporter protein D
MKTKWLAVGISTVSVIILILTSLSNVVGYQTVQTSQQNLIKERINQRELLFQTIVDIANNKEIQRIILKSQMSRGIFPTLKLPVITKNQIRQTYFLGMILSKVISKSKIQSMIGKYQFDNLEMQKEISTVIEKNSILNAEIVQLSNSDCDCKQEGASIFNLLICSIVWILFFPMWIVDEIRVRTEAILLRVIDNFNLYKKLKSLIELIFLPHTILFLSLLIVDMLFGCGI